MKHSSFDLKKQFSSSGASTSSHQSIRQKEYRWNVIRNIKFCHRPFLQFLSFALSYSIISYCLLFSKTRCPFTVSLVAHLNSWAALVLLQHTGVQFQGGAAVVLWAAQLLSLTPPPLAPTSTERGGVSTDGDDPGVRASVHSITYYVTQRACLGGVFARWSIPRTAWAWTSHSSARHKETRTTPVMLVFKKKLCAVPIGINSTFSGSFCYSSSPLQLTVLSLKFAQQSLQACTCATSSSTHMLVHA